MIIIGQRLTKMIIKDHKDHEVLLMIIAKLYHHAKNIIIDLLLTKVAEDINCTQTGDTSHLKESCHHCLYDCCCCCFLRNFVDWRFFVNGS